MATVLEKQGKLEEALELYQKSLDTTIRAVGPDHVSVADTKYNMALVQTQQGDKASAKNCFHEAGLIYSKVYGAEHRMTVQALEQAKRAGGTSSGCCRLS